MLSAGNMRGHQRKYHLVWSVLNALSFMVLLSLLTLGMYRTRRGGGAAAAAAAELNASSLLKPMQWWGHFGLVSPVMGAAWKGWRYLRRFYLAPLIQLLIDGCLILYVVYSIDKVVSIGKCLWIKMRGEKNVVLQKPGACHHMLTSSFSDDDSELMLSTGVPAVGDKCWESSHWRPAILVQLPMYNERECYKQIIAASCHLDWPRDRLMIQVLDDSSDDQLVETIADEVHMWQQSGARIQYIHRPNRSGLKAGALKYGLSLEYAKDYDFVVIFDADFVPHRDYLLRTIPFFFGRHDVALVQARWCYYNSDYNLLTKYQRISLDYHFEVEQQGMAYFYRFMNFNGTAGAWRRAAIEDAGGWESRTTTEDMDLAVRAHLKGWKFLFLNDVTVPCEIPTTYEVYCKQQYRWHAGPMQLFKLMWKPILFAKKFAASKKVNLIVFFFLLRKLLPPIVSMFFFVLLPASILVPEVVAPHWIIFHVPFFFTFVYVMLSDWRLWPLICPFFFIDNVMALVKCKATLDGFFGSENAKEWVVTGKRGSSADLTLQDKAKGSSVSLATKAMSDCATIMIDVASPPQKPSQPKLPTPKIYHMQEIFIAVYLMAASFGSVMFLDGRHSLFLFLQGLSFLLTGCGLLGDIDIV